MKKIFTFLHILVALVINAQVPAYVPTNGLVGYWPFNGNVNDESGNNNNCNNPLGNYDNDRNGFANSSFYGSGSGPSPGSGMYISTLDNFPLANSSRTISVWFKSNLPYPGGNRELFSYGDNTFGTRFGIMLNGSSIGVEYVNGSVLTTFIPDNNWHIITVTYNGLGSSGILIYLDGTLRTTTVSNPIDTLNTLNSFVKTIGRLNDIYNFSGNYDDIGIWNRALTQQEITNLYNSSLPQTTCLPEYVPSNGLVGYWPFCGNANDESGNGNNGTVNGATLTNDRFGNADEAFYFSGSGCDTRIDAQVDTISIQTGLTISSWVLQSGSGCISPRILEFWPASNPNGPGHSVWGWGNGADIALGSTTSTGFSCNSAITGVSNNQWIHVVYTNDGLVGKFYKNGLLTSSVNSNGNPILAGNVAFGRMNHPAYDALDGKLDDIGIWNRALTQQEITGLYNATLNTSTAIENNEISIYPNPAKDRITIDCGNLANVTGYKVKIVNMLGQEVYSGAMNTRHVVVPINSWSGTGVYLVKIYDAANNLLHTKKIIVQ